MKPTSSEDFFTQEAVLSDDITFNAPLSPYALHPKQIFLTGATGLLGAFLLEELLKKTSALVYCLVRGKTVNDASERLIKHLQSYQLWQDSFSPRIVPIVGDLSMPWFGLSETEFQQLATNIDVIYHSAGWINLLFPYEKLKPINVSGVEAALRLASLHQTKPVHFVSSIAVFYSDAHSATETLYESTVPQFHSSLKADYGKSKWVADRLVANAQAKGLPATIYRPVRIMGSSQTGALNDNSELLPRLLKGCIKMGLYPDWDIEITLVPVDYISRAMVSIASHEDAWGKAFHCFNPQPIAWKALMDVIESLGYGMQKVSSEHWSRELRRYATWDNPDDESSKRFFAMLMVAFTGMHYLFHQRPPFDGHNIDSALAGTNITCPPIDDALITRYVRYWQHSGFIPSPHSKD